MIYTYALLLLVGAARGLVLPNGALPLQPHALQSAIDTASQCHRRAEVLLLAKKKKGNSKVSKAANKALLGYVPAKPFRVREFVTIAVCRDYRFSDSNAYKQQLQRLSRNLAVPQLPQLLRRHAARARVARGVGVAGGGG